MEVVRFFVAGERLYDVVFTLLTIFYTRKSDGTENKNNVDKRTSLKDFCEQKPKIIHRSLGNLGICLHYCLYRFSNLNTSNSP